MADAEAKPLRSKSLSSLKLRLLSALVLAPVILFAVWLGGWYFTAMVMAAAVLMVQEWNRLTTGRWMTVVAVFEAVILVAALGLTVHGRVDVAVMSVAVAALLTGLLAKPRGRSVAWTLAALPYLGFPLIGLLWLRNNSPIGAEIIFWLLALTWLCDSAAYFTGKRLGGPKLAPSISPNKTWSGAIGGALAGGIVGAASVDLLGWGTIPVMIVAGIALSSWAQLGDLAESYIKRRFGVKDSGTLIPGHGGLLDRMDSLLFAAPVVALAVFYLT